MGINSGALNNANSLMSQAYSDAVQSESTSMERISTQKKFQNASDDIVDYMSLQKYQNAASANTTIQTNLQNAGADVTAMVSQADSLMSQLTQAQSAFNSGATDAAAQIVNGMKGQLSAKSAAGTTLFFGAGGYAGNGNVTTVGNGGLSLDLGANGTTAVKNAYAALKTGGALDLGDSTKLNSTNNFASAVSDMQTYIGALNGLQENVTAQTTLASVAVSNANALASSVTQIDQAAELANVTDQDIQQQAAISMISQANLSRQNIAALYQ